MENLNASAPPEETKEAPRQPLARHHGTTDASSAPAAQPPSSGRSAILDQGMKWAIRSGCNATIEAAVRRGVSMSAVPVASVVRSRPVPVLGGDSRSGNGTTTNVRGDGPVVIKALTLQLAAKARQIGTFSRLISLGARLDEPGTSVASVRALIKLVTQGPDAAALLPLFFPSGAGNPTDLVRRLGQELRNEALIGLLQGYKPARSSQAPSLEAYLGYIRALFDAGASPELVRRAAFRSTSTLSTAVSTLEPDLVRLLIYRGACPDGPPGLDPPLVPRLPLHVPLCAVAYAMARSLLDPPVQAVLHQIVGVLVAGGADINIHVPYRGRWPTHISFTSPLLVFLDTVDCWDHDGGGPQALDALRFLLARGADPNNPPKHPDHNPGADPWCLPPLYVGRRSWKRPVRADPIADLLGRWGVGKLASPSFALALELLVGHPLTRGGVRKVADTLARYDHTASGTLTPDSLKTGQNDDSILAAWRRLISETARLLTPHELGEFLHAYVVRKGTCPRAGRDSRHDSQTDEVGDLARITITELLAAGADVNHRRADAFRPQDGARPTALHAICSWLAGRAEEEKQFNAWRPSCCGFRHTPRRVEFVRFLVETCGADGGMRYEGRTPGEMLVQLRLPEVEEEETGGRDWGVGEGVAREGREALVALLEKPRPRPLLPPPPPPPPPRASCVCM